MLDNLITSQDHIDDSIVDEKIADDDFDILVTPEFEVDGETYRILLDGHHSLAAAIKTGNEPEISIATNQDHDAIHMIDDGDIEGFLEAVQHEHDFRFAVSGKFVW